MSEYRFPSNELMPMVFDLDGTLCFDGSTIGREITVAVDEVRTAGRPVAFASARPVRDLLPLLPFSWRSELLVGGNGAIVRHGERSQSLFFDQGLRIRIDKVIDEYQLGYLIDAEWDYAYTGPVEHPIARQVDPGRLANMIDRRDLDRYCKVVLFDTDQSVLESFSPGELITHQHAGEGLLDLAPGTTTKASALAVWLPGEYVAFGNDVNDASMFAAATYSVCVGDHPAGAKANRRISPSEVADTILELHRMTGHGSSTASF